jgi:hypothetical protein
MVGEKLARQERVDARREVGRGIVLRQYVESPAPSQELCAITFTVSSEKATPLNSMRWTTSSPAASFTGAEVTGRKPMRRVRMR